ncbi:flagellar hook-associated protein 1 FlgK [Paenibacillaceae bacterium GAS479]|nr:flagellar hook-associated protein 1 FlgK [Paenibacillaceae bacterium GAS479]
MASTFHSIETAKRSLFTQTTALNTTGHNISNANTEGYSRQVVNMKAASSIEAFGVNRSNAPGQLGTGVEFSNIERIRESFLDAQFREENSIKSGWDIQLGTLEKLQTIFNEPSDSGIRTVMQNFWNSWSDLSKDPENITARTIVKENALALTDAFNQISRQLGQLQNDLTSNVEMKAGEVQNHLTSIADLNRSIAKIEGLGDNANDLRDQRDLLTDKLSKIIGITVANGEQGYSISMGGQILVEGFEVAATVNGATLTAAFAGGGLTGGEVYGMLRSRDVYVSDYTQKLDLLARTMAEGDVKMTLPKGSVLPEGTVLDGVTYTGVSRVLTEDIQVTVKGLNGLHQLGYSMQNGPDGKPLTGPPFFSASGGSSLITAGNISLNSTILDNPALIATSLKTSGDGSVVKGNNTLALLMSKLNTGKFNVGTSGTLDSAYAALIGQLGVQTQEAARQADNSNSLLTQVDMRRQSVSGVSLDEEMSELLKFQHAYNAAARFMTTFDELLNKLITGTGVVGR